MTKTPTAGRAQHSRMIHAEWRRIAALGFCALIWATVAVLALRHFHH